MRIDRRRPKGYDMWLGILRTPGIKFRSLQYGEIDEPFMEPLGPVSDMTDTMHRMEDLDLVITVDTSIAHLAGVMGIPVWMLLYRPPEWRWGLDEEREPTGTGPCEFSGRNAGASGVRCLSA